MAGEVASAYVSLLPSAKGFGKSTQRQIGPQMNSVAKTTGSRFGRVFASSTMSPLKAIGVAAVGLFAVAKVKDFFQGAIAEARESQKVSAITAQVIKSTGGAANISAGQVGRLATSISNLTGIDDEAIQSGANLLLTFKNIRNEAGAGNDIFDQTTRIMTDMSVAMGTDAKSSAIQLGKALNDPVKGISALTRVGVTFTEQQKAQIETLVSSGRTLDAQKIILRELNSEFGGTAAAAATAGDRFKTTFANFQEAVGTALLPYLDKALVKGIEIIGFLQDDVPRAFEAFRAAIAPIAEAVRSFVEDHLGAFKVALAALGGSALTSVIALIGGSLVSAIGVLVGALVSPIALIGALAGAAIYAYTHFSGFRNQVNSLAVSARDNLLPALQQAATYMITNVGPALLQVGSVLRSDVLPIVRGFASFMLTQFYPTMIKAWAVVAQKLAPVFVQLAQTYTSKVLPVQKQVLEQLRQYGPVVGPVVAALAKLIGKLLILAATIAGKTMPPSIKLAAVLSGPVFGGLILVMQAAGKAQEAMNAFAKAVVSAVGKAVSAIQSLPGKAKAALGDAGSILYSAGQAIIQGLINGIKSMARSVGDVIRGAIPDVPGLGSIPGLAKGGPVSAGRLYLVGENGPELFTSSRSGYIVPNHKVSGLVGKQSAPDSGGTMEVTLSRATLMEMRRMGFDNSREFGREINGATANARRRSA
jgi:hypothetical protein